MRTRQELQADHEKLLAAHKRLHAQLEKLPNVVSVCIGVKETGGRLTDEPAIKVVVREKVAEDTLASQERIPPEIDGIAIDVIVEPKRTLATGLSGDEQKRRPMRGGIKINNTRNGPGAGGSGTLGCIATRNSGGGVVLLSNHHVLYGDTGKDDDAIGQPWISGFCCCMCNEVAENVAKDKQLDCAIAELDEGIGAENRIEEIGPIGGAVAATSGERVRKRGSRTKLTSGTISTINPGSLDITVTANPMNGPAEDPGGCPHPTSGLSMFAYFGDSGSVVVNDDAEVVGLLYAIDTATELQGFANDIGRVTTQLGITINATSTHPGVTPASSREQDTPPRRFLDTEPVSAGHPAGAGGDGQRRAAGRALEELEARLRRTPQGRHIVDVVRCHLDEAVSLVNERRPVTVAWQRRKGPAFVAALARSARRANYEIPREIDGSSLEFLVVKMAAELEEHGSPALRADVRKYLLVGLDVLQRCRTVEEMLAYVETPGLLQGASEPVHTAARHATL